LRCRPAERRYSQQRLAAVPRNRTEKKAGWRCSQSSAYPSPPIFLFNRENMAWNRDPNLRTRRQNGRQLDGLAVRVDEGGIPMLKAGFDETAGQP